MPITSVKEHVVDRVQREKKGWGKPVVVSQMDLHPGLPGSRVACRPWEPAGMSSSPGGLGPPRHQAGCEKGRRDQRSC